MLARKGPPRQCAAAAAASGDDDESADGPAWHEHGGMFGPLLLLWQPTSLPANVARQGRLEASKRGRDWSARGLADLHLDLHLPSHLRTHSSCKQLEVIPPLQDTCWSRAGHAQHILRGTCWSRALSIYCVALAGHARSA